MSWSPLPVEPAGVADRHDAGDPEAWAQAQQIFLAGNGLPQRWAGRPRFTVLDTGFGLGHGFLATWAAWQQDTRRCDRLVYLAIAPQPPSRETLARAHLSSPLSALAAQLADGWPPLTPDLHLIDLDGGRVRLLLALGDVGRVLPELLAQVDAFFLDGQRSDHEPPDGDRWRLRQLGRLAAPGATLATASTAASLRQGLAAAGFVLNTAPGPADQREITVGRHAPRHVATAAPGRLAWQAAAAAPPRSVAVIGAGLAGSAVAQALARRGLAVQVFDRQGGSARETSGQAGGLFHGIAHPHDGPHARWLRAAALHAARTLRPLVRSAALAGAVQGLLRGEQMLAPAAMQSLLQQLALPADYLQLRRGAAPPGLGAAWFYPDGGWVDPAALCALRLQSPAITTRYGCDVQSLARADVGWRVIGTAGEALCTVDAVVLCNAWDARRLAGPGAAAWPLRQVRGQTTLLADHPGLPAMPLPLADAGYALRLADGRLLCGASAQPDDGDATLREADHRQNLATLQRLTGWASPALQETPLPPLVGRVGWRVQSDDRLPLLGPLPDEAAPPGTRRADRPRWVPRQAGLFMFSALGSRGISQSGLGAEVLAAWISGDALPLPASLLDALDVARFSCRAVRRGDAGSGE